MDSNQQAAADALSALDELHLRLIADREALDRKIAEIEAKQSKYRKMVGTVSARVPSKRRRNPRGYNETIILKAIQDAEDRGEGLGAMEIRALTELSWSSVRQALEKHPELFERGSDGRWYTNKRKQDINLDA